MSVDEISAGDQPTVTSELVSKISVARHSVVGTHFLKIHWDGIVSECGWMLEQLDEKQGACPTS